MALTVEDLKPKPFNFKIKGVEVECKPPRLSHALAITKIGNIFQNPKEYSKQEIHQAERELDEIIGELIPVLRDTQLDIGTSMIIITKIMSVIEPSDNKELREKGVKFDTDPKAEKIG